LCVCRNNNKERSFPSRAQQKQETRASKQAINISAKRRQKIILISFEVSGLFLSDDGYTLIFLIS
jgi:hypothetical protein